MRRWFVAALAVFVFIVFILKSNANFITEYWWFDSLGFKDVYWKFFSYRMSLWGLTALFYFIVLFINYKFASRLSTSAGPVFRIDIPVNIDPGKLMHWGILGVIALISIIAAKATSNSWEDVVRYFYATDFENSDPIFGKNISFYFFTLPFYKLIEQWANGAIIMSIIISGIVYIVNGTIKLIKGWQRFFTGGVKTHITILLFLFISLQGVSYWLSQYDLLYSDGGVVYGAGYADVNARLAGYRIMSVASVLLAGVIVYSIWRKGLMTLIAGFGAYAAVYVAMVALYPAFQQKFVVEPNELEKEKPFIMHNIEYTRKAYALNTIERTNYELTDNISISKLFQNQSTIENIRLWDWRPLLETYRQIQEIRLYYKFRDVDIDRYHVNGKYRQFMISARELAISQVPEQAQTWVNQRLKYTHGYGIVASPVNIVTPDGLPELAVKDIPPVSEFKELKVENPAIYYGEETNHYIFTGTDAEEFDYPMGDSNKLVKYTGTGGVPLSSLFRRILYALDQGGIKVLISGYFNKDSKIHYDRNIVKRASKITPFLIFDHDPYLTIVDGRLKWIIDAYTYGNQYPYAEPYTPAKNINYLRNSVKVVIDAYDGNITYYVSDETDPLIQTYRKIFPSLFTDMSECPQNIKEHFRYPLDYFRVQATMYLSYHMNKPEVFYNREDMWRFPREIYQGAESEMEPYYTIMELDNKKPEFLLILPFTPVNKSNMVAWLAARSDGENYGKLTVYEFPKKELIYGPMQIEARIDQEPSISEVLTLWNQQGSSVIRGNLLVIPIAGSLIYVEPLYLQADQGKMPELKRVIVAHGNNIVMKPNLEEALQAVFIGGGSKLSGKHEIEDLSILIREAIGTFQRGKKALKDGQWADYGKSQEELESLLNQIQKASKK